MAKPFYCSVAARREHRRLISREQNTTGRNTGAKMPKRSRPYEVGLNERLRDPNYAVGYLNAMWEDSVEGFLLALRQVAPAREGMAELADSAGLNRENLYRMLSEEGNP